MAWIVPVASAVVGALGSRAAAQQANQPRNQYTDSTSTQTPYMWQNINPDLEAIINLQRQQIEAGPMYIGGPSAQPTRGTPIGQAGRSPLDGSVAANLRDSGYQGGAPGGDRPGVRGGQGGGASFGGYSAAELANDPSKVARLGASARQKYQQYQASGGGASAGAGAASSGSNAGSAPAINYSDPRAISGEVARRGFEAGNDPTSQAAMAGVRNILSGQGGADSGGTGFQGYNPINDWLAGQLQGDVGDRNAADLIRQFLGAQDGSYGGGASDSAGGSGGYGGSGYTVRGQIPNGHGGWTSSGGGGAGGGSVPDTVGGSNSYFAQQVRSLMDQGASDADVQAIIDRANADTNRSLQQSLWGLDAQAQGTGRFGGDVWAGLGAQARSDAAREMAGNASATRLNELANRRAMQQALLGQVNTRDLGAMQDATQRYGIDASASAAGAGSAAQAELARRGQDLQALGLLLNNDQFNVGALGDLGGQLSGDQLNAMGLAPGLAGIGIAGLGAANNAAGNMFGYDASRAATSAQSGIARAQLNQQASMFNAQQQQNQINDYLRTIMGIGGMGGTSTQQGMNVQPGAGVNPTGAALLGGLSGYLNARGGY